jgi:preprotein translocase subunit SecF
MEFFHRQTHIDFMGIRHITALFSAAVFIISILLLVFKGLNFGLDFTGGTLLDVRFSQSMSIEEIQDKLVEKGFSSAKVTQYGSSRDILIKMANREAMSQETLGKEVLLALDSVENKVELRRVEFVGAEVGKGLAEQGILAVVVALIATMLYIAMRFEYRFAISAAVALLHDPILILGIFAFFQIEFDLAALAAILAVLGYSLNDTIVVYDRVRENFRKIRKGSATEVMNLSINQTLSRTIMTSALTLLVVLALFFFGGESLHGFSTALLIGIVIGTYSSIFVAGALALKLGLSKNDLVRQQRKAIDDMP